MKSINKLFLGLILLFLLSQTVYAYIDPVTGSLIIQGLIAAVVGALAMIKFQYARVKAFINKILGRDARKDKSVDNENGQEFNQKKEKNL